MRYGEVECPGCSGEGSYWEDDDWSRQTEVTCELCGGTGSVSREQALRFIAEKEEASKHRRAIVILAGAVFVTGLIIWQLFKPF